MAEILIDVVAMAARLGQPAGKSGDRFSSGEAVGTQGASSVPPAVQACPLGHQNAVAARFCPECGLPIGEMVLTPRVDLAAVREALRPAHSLDAESKALRDQQHIEALAANARVEQEIADFSVQHDPSRQKVHIHFMVDGFTWAGQVWYAGQEVEIGPEHPRWASALPWIRLTKAEQFQRYGKVFFDAGPFPGRLPPPGTVLPLAEAGTVQWSALRGGVPASASPDGDGSLVPR
jgi:hypothetical protein